MPKFSEILAKLDGEIITTSKKAAGLFSETLTALDKEIEPIVVAAEPAIKQDIEDIITNGMPVVWPLITGGGAPLAIINAGYDYFKAELPHLCEEIWMALASELSLKIKSVTAPTVSQVINAGVAAAVAVPAEPVAGSAS